MREKETKNKDVVVILGTIKIISCYL